MTLLMIKAAGPRGGDRCLFYKKTNPPKLPKIVKEIQIFTKIAQEITKNAPFLQKNHKKLQKIRVFLPQMRPKPTKMRHRRLENFLQKFPKKVVLPPPIN